jgi:pyruvate formate lyase activating enzyme
MHKLETAAGPTRGMVFLIQSYSTSDGPGIRTTVFTKGCSLNCTWCQNPESRNSYPELMTYDEKCIGCGKCLDICPENAVSLDAQTGRKIDRSRCSRCFECVDVCPAKALAAVGEYLSIPQVMAQIEKDELFFWRSDGGVTVSGGEPLLQGPFVCELLKACKERGLHTALDTSGHVPWPTLEEALRYTDLVLYDIKHMDSEAHMRATGANNALVLTNLYKIPRSTRLWLRLPLIPGYNDSRDNLDQVIALSRKTAAEKISLLPFNRYGDGKYRDLGLDMPLFGVGALTKQKAEQIKTYLESSGLPVTIGE